MTWGPGMGYDEVCDTLCQKGGGEGIENIFKKV